MAKADSRAGRFTLRVLIGDVRGRWASRRPRPCAARPCGFCNLLSRLDEDVPAQEPGEPGAQARRQDGQQVPKLREVRGPQVVLFAVNLREAREHPLALGNTEGLC